MPSLPPCLCPAGFHIASTRVLVQGATHTLHMLVNRGGTQYLLAAQLFAVFGVMFAISRSSWGRHLNPHSSPLSSNLLRVFKMVGALPGNTNSACRLCQSKALRAMRRAGVADEAVRALQSALRGGARMVVSPGPTPGGGGRGSSSNPSSLLVQPLPPSTPALVLQAAHSSPGSRYGLRHVGSRARGLLAGVRPEVAEFRAWCMAVMVPHRPAWVEKLSSSSWAKVEKGLHQYLGFCYHYQSVHAPRLHHYLRGPYILAFYEFLQLRGVSKANLLQHLYTACRVTAWLEGKLQQQGDLVPAAAARELGGEVWGVHTQVARNMHSPPMKNEGQLLAVGGWMLPGDLLHRVTAVRTKALRMLAAYRSGGEGSPSKVEVAAQLMCAILCCMLYGWMPPQRPSVLVSLMLPSYAGPCMSLDCQLSRREAPCGGNKLSWVEGSLHTALGMHAPHHKTAKYRGRRALSLRLPDDLNVLLVPYLLWGQKALTAAMAAAGERAMYTFVDLSTGAQLTTEGLYGIWNEQVLQGSGCKFGPKVARAIWVGERCSRDPAAGPDDRGASMAMGHTERAWRSSYDRFWDEREAQAAVDSMQDWRSSLLARSSHGDGAEQSAG